MLTHGMSKSLVHCSVCGVVNAVHMESLFFNNEAKDFPSHEEQREFVEWFKEMSTAKFDMVSMAVNGILTWTIQPSSIECAWLEIGQRFFPCYHQDKFGMVLMDGCNHRCKFSWADIRHSGITSDYLAFSTSELGWKLNQDKSNILLQGNTLIGDNVWVATPWMTTLIHSKWL